MRRKSWIAVWIALFLVAADQGAAGPIEVGFDLGAGVQFWDEPETLIPFPPLDTTQLRQARIQIPRPELRLAYYFTDQVALEQLIQWTEIYERGRLRASTTRYDAGPVFYWRADGTSPFVRLRARLVGNSYFALGTGLRFFPTTHGLLRVEGGIARGTDVFLDESDQVIFVGSFLEPYVNLGFSIRP